MNSPCGKVPTSTLHDPCMHPPLFMTPAKSICAGGFSAFPVRACLAAVLCVSVAPPPRDCARNSTRGVRDRRLQPHFVLSTSTERRGVGLTQHPPPGLPCWNQVQLPSADPRAMVPSPRVENIKEHSHVPILVVWQMAMTTCCLLTPLFLKQSTILDKARYHASLPIASALPVAHRASHLPTCAAVHMQVMMVLSAKPSWPARRASCSRSSASFGRRERRRRRAHPPLPPSLHPPPSTTWARRSHLRWRSLCGR